MPTSTNTANAIIGFITVVVLPLCFICAPIPCCPGAMVLSLFI